MDHPRILLDAVCDFSLWFLNQDFPWIVLFLYTQVKPYLKGSSMIKHKASICSYFMECIVWFGSHNVFSLYSNIRDSIWHIDITDGNSVMVGDRWLMVWSNGWKFPAVCQARSNTRLRDNTFCICCTTKICKSTSDQVDNKFLKRGRLSKCTDSTLLCLQLHALVGYRGRSKISQTYIKFRYFFIKFKTHSVHLV